MKKPFVLLTNDDGISAPGLYALYEALSPVADIAVVAPDSERSAAGHAITIANPLRVHKYERNGAFFGHAVNGTPADCVKLAYYALLDRRPDAVVSGINFGSNTGINVIYSGTVSAATEGTILGIPSFAISLATYHDPHFDTAGEVARKFLPVLLEKSIPQGVLININVPNVPHEELQGFRVTRQGKSQYEDRYEERRDPRNHIYYWLTGSRVNLEKDIEYDDGAVYGNYVSITPIHYDLTEYAYLKEMQTWDIQL